MTSQPQRGIDGVLNNLLSTGHAHAEPNAKNESTPTEHPRVSDAAESGLSRATGARRGRPLGPHRREAGPKDKVTFRISCEISISGSCTSNRTKLFEFHRSSFPTVSRNTSDGSTTTPTQIDVQSLLATNPDKHGFASQRNMAFGHEL